MTGEETTQEGRADAPLERVRAFLKTHDRSLEPLVFQAPLPTSEAAAEKLGCALAQIAKSILFKAKDDYGLFVAAGDVRVDQRVVKELLGGKPRIARPEEVLEQTGFRVGAVCPFALKEEIPVFVDRSLGRFDTVYTAAGVPESILAISFDRLVEITQGVLVDASGAAGPTR